MNFFLFCVYTNGQDSRYHYLSIFPPFSLSLSRRFAGPLAKVLQLIDDSVQIEGEAKQAIVITRNVLRRICRAFQHLNETGTMQGIFKTDSMNRLVTAATNLPEVAAVVVNSFLKEDLHRFLTENQLMSILGTFPATFCKGADIWNYFDKSGGAENFRNALCSMNISAIEEDFLREFNIFSMENTTSTVGIMGNMLESAGCIVDAGLVMNWERLVIVDTSPIMRTLGMIQSYAPMFSDPW